MGRRNADEGVWFGVGNTLAECLPAHAGIDQHRHRAHLEQGKDDGQQLDAWPDHHQHAIALLDAILGQSVSAAIALLVELLEAQLDEFGPTIWIAPSWEQDRRFERHLGSHFGHRLSHVVAFQP